MFSPSGGACRWETQALLTAPRGESPASARFMSGGRRPRLCRKAAGPAWPKSDGLLEDLQVGGNAAADAHCWIRPPPPRRRAGSRIIGAMDADANGSPFPRRRRTAGAGSSPSSSTKSLCTLPVFAGGTNEQAAEFPRQHSPNAPGLDAMIWPNHVCRSQIGEGLWSSLITFCRQGPFGGASAETDGG